MPSKTQLLPIFMFASVYWATTCSAGGQMTLHARFDTFLRLVQAVTEQDKTMVRSLLRTGVNPNIHIQYGAEMNC